MAKYGLQRGIDGSTARHKSTQQYYRDTQKLVDSLKAEVVDLQERKEAARQELRQAKKEVQTEKLKGAATTAATNIAESVGSFSAATRSRRWRGRTRICMSVYQNFKKKPDKGNSNRRNTYRR